ncbi:MAG: PP2C family protein-serine/threonine phosphatase, partial [Geminicoccales bacterium]
MTVQGTQLQSAVRSHVGHVRELNEDACLARPDLGIWAVADGMGGHDCGDYASGLIIGELGRVRRADSARELLHEVDATLARCNRTLLERARDGELSGSTIVALLVFEQNFAAIWAGDSRLYRLRDGRLEQLTRDHSYVQELVERGELAPDRARAHPLGNRITRAIGADPQLHLDVVDGRLEPDDLFLLCSDGLTGMVDDAAIAGILTGTDVEAAADRLIDAALAAGGNDNVSAIVVRNAPGLDGEQTVPH